MAVYFADGLAGEGGKVRPGVHDEAVSPGGFSEVLEDFRVEFADDVFAVFVFPKAVFFPGIGDGSPGYCADAYGDDEEFAAFGFLRHGKGGFFGILAIAEDDEGIGAIRCAAFEILHGFAENHAEVCAAHAGPTTVNLFQGIAQGGVVVGEGDDEIRFSGKDDEADFIPGESIDEVVCGGTGFFQPGGNHIRGFHGAGDIQRDDEVSAAGGGATFPKAVDGAG